MKVHNPPLLEPLHSELKAKLTEYRWQRNYRSDKCVQVKSFYLNHYFRTNKLSAAVVAVSGGIDSAVVLALVNAAMKEKDSPIKKLVPVLLPCNTRGATNQLDTIERGVELCKTLNLTANVIDMRKPRNLIREEVFNGLNIHSGAWADGQLIPYMRTAILYYITSLLNQEGTPAIIVGTTNKDEGAYLGYFGKASDGMVDVQLISDLHKHEVKKLATFLNIPQSIRDIAPNGDMYDSRTDEEVFGAPYDFVELYLHQMEQGAFGYNPLAWIGQFSAKAQSQFIKLGANLEKLHDYNAHKYQVGSPAYHLDIYDSNIIGGWKHLPVRTIPPKGNFVGDFKLPPFKQSWKDRITIDKRHVDDKDTIVIANHLFSTEETEQLANAPKQWIPVGLNGILSHYKKGDPIGSYRATAYNEQFAQLIWERLSPWIGGPRLFHPLESTDLDSSQLWVAVGVNPAIRFIKYEKDGTLIPHRDAPFIFDKNFRTLQSLVIYLTSSDAGTRFIVDIQRHLPVEQRDLCDWNRSPTEEEILGVINPKVGSALIFNHRLIHDSAPVMEEGKIIIRTDIIYRKVC